MAERFETKEINMMEYLHHVRLLAEEGHDVTIRLRGYSMRPFLEHDRDKGVLTKIDRKLRVGDVVLAKITPQKYALHRIIYVDDHKVQMLGDGNLHADPVIPLSEVKLLAKGFFRKGSKKMDSVDGRLFRTYSRVWMKFRPVRRYLLAIWRRIPRPLRDRLL